jgi:hypothetical protein
VKTKQVADASDVNFTGVPLPEAAAKALDPRTLPDTHSEFCRMHDLRRLFGITRSTGYNLIAAGLITAISLRRKGQARSVRLVSVPSVRAYLNRLIAEQTTPEPQATSGKPEGGK